MAKTLRSFKTSGMIRFQIDQNAVGIESALVGTDLSNIASALDAQERPENYPQALAYHKRALALHKAALGEGDPTIAMDFNNIGVVLSHQKEFEEAVRNYARAIAIAELSLGSDDDDLAAFL
jgi:tetratricopeptide (TPR) repeat protein